MRKLWIFGLVGASLAGCSTNASNDDSSDSAAARFVKSAPVVDARFNSDVPAWAKYAALNNIPFPMCIGESELRVTLSKENIREVSAQLKVLGEGDFVGLRQLIDQISADDAATGHVPVLRDRWGFYGEPGPGEVETFNTLGCVYLRSRFSIEQWAKVSHLVTTDDSQIPEVVSPALEQVIARSSAQCTGRGFAAADGETVCTKRDFRYMPCNEASMLIDPQGASQMQWTCETRAPFASVESDLQFSLPDGETSALFGVETSDCFRCYHQPSVAAFFERRMPLGKDGNLRVTQYFGHYSNGTNTGKLVGLHAATDGVSVDGSLEVFAPFYGSMIYNEVNVSPLSGVIAIEGMNPDYSFSTVAMMHLDKTKPVANKASAFGPGEVIGYLAPPDAFRLVTNSKGENVRQWYASQTGFPTHCHFAEIDADATSLLKKNLINGFLGSYAKNTIRGVPSSVALKNPDGPGVYKPFSTESFIVRSGQAQPAL